MSDVVVSIHNLSKLYHIGYYNPFLAWRQRTLYSAKETIYSAFHKSLPNGNSAQQGTSLYALKDVSFDVHRGEIVGIIGKNGAGKSTLLKILAKITRPTSGYVDIYGKVGALLEVGTGFHPELSGRENIFLNAAILGLTNDEIRRLFDEIVAFAEIEPFIDTAVKYYSSGMYARLAFSVAAHLSPEILIVDEVLSVGDIGFQKKSLGKMEDVVKGGRTVILVSHAVGQIVSFCNRCLWLDKGAVMLDGPTNEVVKAYQEQVQTYRFQQQPQIARTSLGAAEHGHEIVLNTEPIDWNEQTPLNRDESHLSQRYGNGKARFTSIAFSPLDPETQAPHRVLRCGDDLELVFTVRAVEEVVNMQLDFSIRDRNGNLVIFSSPITKGYPLDLHPNEQVRVTLVLKNLLLKPGEYILGVYLGRRGYYNIDGLLNVFQFDVEPRLEMINYDHLYPGLYECDYTVKMDKLENA